MPETLSDFTYYYYYIVVDVLQMKKKHSSLTMTHTSKLHG